MQFGKNTLGETKEMKDVLVHFLGVRSGNIEGEMD